MDENPKGEGEPRNDDGKHHHQNDYEPPATEKEQQVDSDNKDDDVENREIKEKSDNGGDHHHLEQQREEEETEPVEITSTTPKQQDVAVGEKYTEMDETGNTKLTTPVEQQQQQPIEETADPSTVVTAAVSAKSFFGQQQLVLEPSTPPPAAAAAAASNTLSEETNTTITTPPLLLLPKNDDDDEKTVALILFMAMAQEEVAVDDSRRHGKKKEDDPIFPNFLRSHHQEEEQAQEAVTVTTSATSTRQETSTTSSAIPAGAGIVVADDSTFTTTTRTEQQQQQPPTTTATTTSSFTTAANDDEKKVAMAMYTELAKQQGQEEDDGSKVASAAAVPDAADTPPPRRRPLPDFCDNDYYFVEASSCSTTTVGVANHLHRFCEDNADTVTENVEEDADALLVVAAAASSCTTTQPVEAATAIAARVDQDAAMIASTEQHQQQLPAVAAGNTAAAATDGNHDEVVLVDESEFHLPPEEQGEATTNKNIVLPVVVPVVALAAPNTDDDDDEAVQKEGRQDAEDGIVTTGPTEEDVDASNKAKHLASDASAESTATTNKAENQTASEVAEVGKEQVQQTGSESKHAGEEEDEQEPEFHIPAEISESTAVVDNSPKPAVTSAFIEYDTVNKEKEVALKANNSVSELTTGRGACDFMALDMPVVGTSTKLAVTNMNESRKIDEDEAELHIPAAIDKASTDPAVVSMNSEQHSPTNEGREEVDRTTQEKEGVASTCRGIAIIKVGVETVEESTEQAQQSGNETKQMNEDEVEIHIPAFTDDAVANDSTEPGVSWVSTQHNSADERKEAMDGTTPEQEKVDATNETGMSDVIIAEQTREVVTDVLTDPCAPSFSIKNADAIKKEVDPMDWTSIEQPNESIGNSLVDRAVVDFSNLYNDDTVEKKAGKGFVHKHTSDAAELETTFVGDIDETQSENDDSKRHQDFPINSAYGTPFAETRPMPENPKTPTVTAAMNDTDVVIQIDISSETEDKLADSLLKVQQNEGAGRAIRLRTDESSDLLMSKATSEKASSRVDDQQQQASCTTPARVQEVALGKMDAKIDSSSEENHVASSKNHGIVADQQAKKDAARKSATGASSEVDVVACNVMDPLASFSTGQNDANKDLMNPASGMATHGAKEAVLNDEVASNAIMAFTAQDDVKATDGNTAVGGTPAEPAITTVSLENCLESEITAGITAEQGGDATVETLADPFSSEIPAEQGRSSDETAKAERLAAEKLDVTTLEFGPDASCDDTRNTKDESTISQMSSAVEDIEADRTAPIVSGENEGSTRVNEHMSSAEDRAVQAAPDMTETAAATTTQIDDTFEKNPADGIASECAKKAVAHNSTNPVAAHFSTDRDKVGKAIEQTGEITTAEVKETAVDTHADPVVFQIPTVKGGLNNEAYGICAITTNQSENGTVDENSENAAEDFVIHSSTINVRCNHGADSIEKDREVGPDSQEKKEATDEEATVHLTQKVHLADRDATEEAYSKTTEHSGQEIASDTFLDTVKNVGSTMAGSVATTPPVSPLPEHAQRTESELVDPAVEVASKSAEFMREHQLAGDLADLAGEESCKTAAFQIGNVEENSNKVKYRAALDSAAHEWKGTFSEVDAGAPKSGEKGELASGGIVADDSVTRDKDAVKSNDADALESETGIFTGSPPGNAATAAAPQSERGALHERSRPSGETQHTTSDEQKSRPVCLDAVERSAASGKIHDSTIEAVAFVKSELLDAPLPGEEAGKQVNIPEEMEIDFTAGLLEHTSGAVQHVDRVVNDLPMESRQLVDDKLNSLPAQSGEMKHQEFVDLKKSKQLPRVATLSMSAPASVETHHDPKPSMHPAGLPRLNLMKKSTTQGPDARHKPSKKLGGLPRVAWIQKPKTPDAGREPSHKLAGPPRVASIEKQQAAEARHVTLADKKLPTLPRVANLAPKTPPRNPSASSRSSPTSSSASQRRSPKSSSKPFLWSGTGLLDTPLPRVATLPIAKPALDADLPVGQHSTTTQIKGLPRVATLKKSTAVQDTEVEIKATPPKKLVRLPRVATLPTPSAAKSGVDMNGKKPSTPRTTEPAGLPRVATLKPKKPVISSNAAPTLATKTIDGLHRIATLSKSPLNSRAGEDVEVATNIHKSSTIAAVGSPPAGSADKQVREFGVFLEKQRDSESELSSEMNVKLNELLSPGDVSTQETPSGAMKDSEVGISQSDVQMLDRSIENTPKLEATILNEAHAFAPAMGVSDGPADK